MQHRLLYTKLPNRTEQVADKGLDHWRARKLVHGIKKTSNPAEMYIGGTVTWDVAPQLHGSILFVNKHLNSIQMPELKTLFAGEKWHYYGWAGHKKASKSWEVSRGYREFYSEKHASLFSVNGNLHGVCNDSSLIQGNVIGDNVTLEHKQELQVGRLAMQNKMIIPNNFKQIIALKDCVYPSMLWVADEMHNSYVMRPINKFLLNNNLDSIKRIVITKDGLKQVSSTNMPYRRLLPPMLSNKLLIRALIKHVGNITFTEQDLSFQQLELILRKNAEQFVKAGKQLADVNPNLAHLEISVKELNLRARYALLDSMHIKKVLPKDIELVINKIRMQNAIFYGAFQPGLLSAKDYHPQAMRSTPSLYRYWVGSLSPTEREFLFGFSRVLWDIIGVGHKDTYINSVKPYVYAIYFNKDVSTINKHKETLSSYLQRNPRLTHFLLNNLSRLDGLAKHFYQYLQNFNKQTVTEFSSYAGEAYKINFTGKFTNSLFDIISAMQAKTQTSFLDWYLAQVTKHKSYKDALQEKFIRFASSHPDLANSYFRGELRTKALVYYMRLHNNPKNLEINKEITEYGKRAFDVYVQQLTSGLWKGAVLDLEHLANIMGVDFALHTVHKDLNTGRLLSNNKAILIKSPLRSIKKIHLLTNGNGFLVAEPTSAPRTDVVLKNQAELDQELNLECCGGVTHPMLISRKESYRHVNGREEQVLNDYIILPESANNHLYHKGAGGIFANKNLHINGIGSNAKLNLSGVLHARKDIIIEGENAEIVRSQYKLKHIVTSIKKSKALLKRACVKNDRSLKETKESNLGSGIIAADNKVTLKLRNNLLIRGGAISGRKGVDIDVKNFHLRPNIDVKLTNCSSFGKCFVKSKSINTLLERYSIKNVDILALDGKININVHGTMTSTATNYIGKQIKLWVANNLCLLPKIIRESSGIQYSGRGLAEHSWQEEFIEQGKENVFVAYDDTISIKVNGSVQDIGTKMYGVGVKIDAKHNIIQRGYHLQRKTHGKRKKFTKGKLIFETSEENHQDCSLSPGINSQEDINIVSRTGDITSNGVKYHSEKDTSIIAEKGDINILGSNRKHTINTKGLNVGFGCTGSSVVESLLTGSITKSLHRALEEISPLSAAICSTAQSRSIEELASKSLFTLTRLYSIHKSLQKQQASILNPKPAAITDYFIKELDFQAFIRAGKYKSTKQWNEFVQPFMQAGGGLTIMGRDVTLESIEAECKKLIIKSSRDLKMKPGIEELNTKTSEIGLTTGAGVKGGLFAGLDYQKGKTQVVQNVYGHISADKSEITSGRDIKILGMIINTSHLYLKAARDILLKSMQDLHKSKRWGFSAATNLAVSMNHAKSKEHVTNTQSKVIAKKSFFASAGNSVELGGSILQVASEGSALFNREEDANYYEFKMPVDGDGYLHCFNLSRPQAVMKLLAHKHNSDIRRLVALDIEQALRENSLPAIMQSIERPALTNQTDVENYCMQEDVFEAYITFRLGAPSNNNSFVGWVSYKDKGLLNAISKISHKNIIIFEESSAGELTTLHRNIFNTNWGAQDTIKILHRTIYPDVTDLNKRLSKFSLLYPNPGVIVGKIFKYNDISDRSVTKENQLSIGATVINPTIKRAKKTGTAHATVSDNIKGVGFSNLQCNSNMDETYTGGKQKKFDFSVELPIGLHDVRTKLASMQNATTKELPLQALMQRAISHEKLANANSQQNSTLESSVAVANAVNDSAVNDDENLSNDINDINIDSKSNIQHTNKQIVNASIINTKTSYPPKATESTHVKVSEKLRDYNPGIPAAKHVDTEKSVNNVINIFENEPKGSRIVTALDKFDKVFTTQQQKYDFNQPTYLKYNTDSYNPNITEKIFSQSINPYVLSSGFASIVPQKNTSSIFTSVKDFGSRIFERTDFSDPASSWRPMSTPTIVKVHTKIRDKDKNNRVHYRDLSGGKYSKSPWKLAKEDFSFKNRTSVSFNFVDKTNNITKGYEGLFIKDYLRYNIKGHKDCQVGPLAYFQWNAGKIKYASTCKETILDTNVGFTGGVNLLSLKTDSAVGTVRADVDFMEVALKANMKYVNDTKKVEFYAVCLAKVEAVSTKFDFHTQPICIMGNCYTVGVEAASSIGGRFNVEMEYVSDKHTGKKVVNLSAGAGLGSTVSLFFSFVKEPIAINESNEKHTQSSSISPMRVNGLIK